MVNQKCPDCGERFDAGVEVCPYDGTPLSGDHVESDDLIGSVVGGNFRLDSILGQGGMGRVYRGTQLSVDRPVAVKLIRTGVLGGEEVERRFYREARVVSGFSHPNIVRLIDFGEDPDLGVPYLAMEHIDGVSLTELLRGRRFHPNLATEIASQMAAGLSDAHDAGIVHRDLKTENVLVVPISPGRIQAKLIDFGLAHPGETSKRLTQSGAIFGTPQYLSPQQARGKKVGPASDIYSLGVILYEMIAGRLPFGGDTAFEIMVSHVRSEPPSLDRLVPEGSVPEALCTLVHRMLAKKPGDRPSDISEVLDRLDRIRTGADWAPIRVDTSESLSEGVERWTSPVSDADGIGAGRSSEAGGASATPGQSARGPTTSRNREVSDEDVLQVAETLGLEEVQVEEPVASGDVRERESTAARADGAEKAVHASTGGRAAQGGETERMSTPIRSDAEMQREGEPFDEEAAPTVRSLASVGLVSLLVGVAVGGWFLWDQRGASSDATSSAIPAHPDSGSSHVVSSGAHPDAGGPDAERTDVRLDASQRYDGGDGTMGDSDGGEREPDIAPRSVEAESERDEEQAEPVRRAGGAAESGRSPAEGAHEPESEVERDRGRGGGTSENRGSRPAGGTAESESDDVDKNFEKQLDWVDPN